MGCCIISRMILRNATVENTPKFSFASIGITHGKVIDVYDGDTCTVAVECPSLQYHCGVCRTHKRGIVQIRVRMLGYDSPEIKPRKKDKSGRERTAEEIAREKKDALTQRHALMDLVQDKIVRIEINEKPPMDNFGRLLARLYISDKSRFGFGTTERCVNDIMMLDANNIPFDAKADRIAIRDNGVGVGVGVGSISIS